MRAERRRGSPAPPRPVPPPARPGSTPVRPVVVLEAGPAAAAVEARVRRRLADDGWRLVDGFDARPALARVVLAGTVASPGDAAAALTAAIDGFGLLVLAGPLPRGDLDRLVDDLRRLGPVEVHDGSAPAAVDEDAGEAEGLRILALLAEGHTLGDAADQLGISRRTADRRLAAARGTLGVTRTTEAIAIAARRGLLGGRRPA